MTQLGLGFALTIDQRFQTFVSEHPEVYDELVRLAREAKSRGVSKIGIRLLWERVRWSMLVEKGNDEFAMNDHFHSRMVRLIMEREPDLAGMFETRELRAD